MQKGQMQKEQMQKEQMLLEDTLDVAWMQSVQKEEINYRDFYKEVVSSVKLCCCYVNQHAELETFKTEPLVVQHPGLISRAEILQAIKRHQWSDYKLLALLRYNVNLTADEVPDFVATADTSYAHRFLTSEKYVDDIVFPPTITTFNDLNTVFLIFRQKSPASASSTSTSTSMSTTRKIKLTPKKHKGTRRYQYP